MRGLCYQVGAFFCKGDSYWHQATNEYVTKREKQHIEVSESSMTALS